MNYKDPASDEAQDELEDALDAIGVAIGVSALLIISNALERVSDGITMSEALAASGADMTAFKSVLQDGAERYKKVIQEMYSTLAKNNDIWAERFYKHANAKQIPAFEHPKMSEAIATNEKNAIKSIRGICNTSVVGLVDRNGQFVPYAEEYRRLVQMAVTSMEIGKSTYTTEIRRVCKELSKSGIRVQYESGVTREVYGVVRTNIMDGYRDTMYKLRSIQGSEYGAEDVEVSAHAMCAPDHLPYQGLQFTKKEFKKLQEGELKSRPIEIGANCRHMTYPVIKGLTEPAHSKAQLNQYKVQSNGVVTFQGMGGNKLAMTGYEATQYQRQVERRIRTLNTESKVLEGAGFPNFAKLAKRDAYDYKAYYQYMCEETRLTPRLERTRAYVLH